MVLWEIATPIENHCQILPHSPDFEVLNLPHPPHQLICLKSQKFSPSNFFLNFFQASSTWAVVEFVKIFALKFSRPHILSSGETSPLEYRKNANSGKGQENWMWLRNAGKILWKRYDATTGTLGLFSAASSAWKPTQNYGGTVSLPFPFDTLSVVR